MTGFSIAKQLLDSEKYFAAWALIESLAPPGGEKFHEYMFQLSDLLLKVRAKVPASIYLLMEERAKRVLADHIGSHEDGDIEETVRLINEVYAGDGICSDEGMVSKFLYVLVFKRFEVDPLTVLKLLCILKVEDPDVLLPDAGSISHIALSELRGFAGKASSLRLHVLSRHIAEIIIALTPNVLWEFLFIGKAYESECKYESALEQYTKFSKKAKETENMLALKESARRVISMIKITSLDAEVLGDFISSLPVAISSSQEVEDLRFDVLNLIELKKNASTFNPIETLQNSLGYSFVDHDSALNMTDSLESRVQVHPNHIDFYALAKCQIALGRIEDAKQSLWKAYCSNALMFG